MLAPLPLLVVEGLATPAAAQITWSGTTSSDWFTGSNWAGGLVPGGGDQVVIDTAPRGAVVSGSSAAANSVTVGSSGSGTLTLGSGGSLAIWGSGAPGAESGTLFLGAGNGTSGTFYVGGGSDDPADAAEAGSLLGQGVELDNGTVVFNHTGSGYLFSQDISGDGTVEVLAGTTELNGFNDYYGTTEVTGGTLVGENDYALSENSDFVVGSGGTVKVATGIDALIAGLSGSGSVVIEGSSSLTVDPFDGTSREFSGSITGDGELDVSGYGDLTLSGSSHIGGALVLCDCSVSTLKIDGGSFTADSGVYVYGGTLTVSGGGELASSTGVGIAPYAELKIGDGGTAGVVDTPEIANYGTITADFDDSLTISADITGDGSLVKQGDGTLTLTGTNSYSDTTRVLEGTLIVDGSLDSPVRVGRNGRLGGSGILNGGFVARGTVAPGNSVGTLTVEGGIEFKEGSTYEVEVDPEGSGSDLIHATGEADIEGGTVAHVGPDGNYRRTATYTILTADGGVSGRFDGVRSSYPFLTPTLSYDANNVYLRLARNDRHFADVAVSANHKAIAAAVESVGSGGKVYDAVAGVTDDSAALDAFDALSGDLHANVASAQIQQSQLPRQAVAERLQRAFLPPRAPVQRALVGASDAAEAEVTPPESRTTTWIQGFGGWGSNDSDGNAAAIDQSINGFLIGADTRISEHWRLGLFTGYDRREIQVTHADSSASADSVHVGLYGGARYGAFGLALGASYTRHAVSTSRAVVFSGFDETVKADYGAATEQVFGEASYDLDLGALALQPFAGLAWVRGESDSFEETGGEAALKVDANDQALTFGTLGARAATALVLDGLPELTASARLGWRHAFGELAPDGSGHLAGGDSFTIYGLPVPRDVALVGAGLSVPLTEDTSADLAYSGQFGNGFRQHSLQLDLLLRF